MEKNEILRSKKLYLFDMDEGMETEMVEVKKGFVIARVDKVAPAHTEEFDKVKNDLVKDWTRSEQKKQAYVRANEILVDLNKDGKLASKKSVNVSRTAGAPVSLLNMVFNNPIKTKTIVPDTDAFYVVDVKSETMPKMDAKKLDTIRKEVKTVSESALMDDYNSFLNREYPVRVNEKVFNRVFAK